MTFKVLVLSVMLLAFAQAISAQTVDPVTVTWDHAGFATAVSYELSYFALPVLADHTCNWAGTPAAAPAQTGSIPRPSTTTGVGMSATLVSKPVGCYVAKMRALDASGLWSPYSDATTPFAWLPVAPAKPVLK